MDGWSPRGFSRSSNPARRLGRASRGYEKDHDPGSWEPRRWVGLRAFYVLASAVVLLYSAMVLAHVAWMGTIGVRCMFGTTVEEEVSPEFVWRDAQGRELRPTVGDDLLWIDGMSLEGGDYSSYLQALRGLAGRIGEPVEVGWRSGVDGRTHVAEAVVRYPPTRAYVWSFIWFLQELFIFGVGARVFWRRPNDDSARLFFMLCIVTVGAFMGGYHWTEIVLRPSLIYPFVFFALLVPAVNLHFYMVFPRPSPLILVHRRLVLGVLYGIPAAFLAALWGSMYALWRFRVVDAAPERTATLEWIRTLALSYVWVAVVFFGLCFLSLIISFRRARNRGERNQVKWILLATAISALLIGYLMAQTLSDPANLGRDSAAWPMFTMSLLYTIAHAFSITRYKLLQVEEIFNRSVVYVTLSVTAGLIYSALLLVGGKLIGDRLAEVRAMSWGAVVAAASVILVLIFSEVARGRFQRVLDRRFFREKYKFDQAMQKMRLAVGSLVDRATLGRRLLEGTAEILRLEWGALYLADSQAGSYELAACHGPTPDDRVLDSDNPLVARLRQSPTLWRAHVPGSAGASDPAADAMIAIGGEAACGVGGDGELAGVLVLGPKRSGMPYEEEEMAFLGALGSVAALALHSADIQRTLEELNHDLRDKVEKIAAQQQRIMILQDQLRDRAERELAGRPDEAERGGLDEPGEALAAFDRIKGSSPAARRMLSVARKVAASSSAVLIRGESGTGKELLAAAVHAASPRADRPFVKVHCAALSQALLESELFGHVKGAFTGADRDRVGRFEQADGGTLFLDEIGDINLEVQTKLLRVLQEMAFERVGSSQTIHVDVRIIAATHQDLESLIDQGKFREDLFYRLNVIRLTTPSLRERREDVLELALHFLDVHAARAGKVLTHIDPEAVEALIAHDWPGNVRELENTIERAVVLADGPSLSIDDLSPEVRQPTRRRHRLRPSPTGAVSTSARPTRPSPSSSAHDRPTPTSDEWSAEFAEFERQRLIEALEEAEGNKSVAARLLGMPRSTFFSKLKKHGMA